MGTIRTVELFAGVGGFRLGLESASDRFKVIWANQWEPSMREQYAFECYTAHFGSQKYHVCQDIAKAKIIIKRRFFAILQKRYVCKALSLCTSMLWRMVF